MRLIPFLTLVLLAASCQQKSPNPIFEVYDYEVASLIDLSAELEVLADSLILPEGPVWNSQNGELLFVDNLQNKILSWSETYGIQDHMLNAGNTGYAPNLGAGLLGPNGLAIGADNQLYLCQMGDRRVAKTNNQPSKKPEFSTVADNYDGQILNSPNDLVVTSTGDVFFTDPPFAFFDPGAMRFMDTELRQLDFSGVFKVDHNGGAVSVVDTLGVPNGLGLSPDNRFLYVNKMGKPFSNSDSQIVKIDLTTGRGEEFFNADALVKKYNNGTDLDGMDVHSSGHIFTAGPGGLLIISPEGDLMARVDTGQITNCTFDDRESYLYITGFMNNPKLFRIKMK